jgi:nifR3 family TIM-barrel protein
MSYEQLPNEYHVGHIRIRPNIVLAPMVGVTDSIFRRTILSLGGCGLVSSEMTNAASVSPKARARHNQLEFLPEERPITIQLSGNDPDLVANAAKQVEQIGADILDINCGCPSPKVTGGGHGSALLKDLCKMEQLIKAVIAAVQIPVTLKYRAGWDENSLNYLDTAKMAEAAGIKALALHPRTRAQLYTGLADWFGRCQRRPRGPTPPRGLQCQRYHDWAWCHGESMVVHANRSVAPWRDAVCASTCRQV